MADISTITNVSSNAIKAAEEANSKVASPLGSTTDDGSSFSDIFSKAVDNLNTTNSYLSDAENEEIKWSLGQTDNTHDLTIALQKASTALQYTVAVRDRALSAYRELMQMQF
ncbi:MAG: flagellar hook-basal body complex protein FliE [Butyrivibrio sp.]|jgi:flagellar hook-basal body complex protein FliE|nr:flagellar hook-basal body complex protein FliE [Butyrivibrio sp.]